MRLLTKTGNVAASIEMVSGDDVLESDDPFMHRFQHSTIAESILLLASAHKEKIEKEQTSTRDLSTVAAFPEKVGKVLSKVDLLSSDSSVQNIEDLDGDSKVNHATLIAFVDDTIKGLQRLEVDVRLHIRLHIGLDCPLAYLFACPLAYPTMWLPSCACGFAFALYACMLACMSACMLAVVVLSACMLLQLHVPHACPTVHVTV